MAPVVLAKALEEEKLNLQLTVGGSIKTEKELELLGVQIQATDAQGLVIDEKGEHHKLKQTCAKDQAWQTGYQMGLALKKYL